MQLQWCVLLVGVLAHYGVESRSDNCFDERDDCHAITENMRDRKTLFDYCHSWRHTKSIQQCRKTCGLCRETASFPECVDELDECRRISQVFYPNNPRGVASYCQYYSQNPIVQRCKETCPGLCTKPPSARCEDKSEHCRDIVAYGQGRREEIDRYCYNNRHTSLVQSCMKTCRNLCDSETGGDIGFGCVDESDACHEIVKINKGDQAAIESYCQTYRDHSTVKKCRRTCNTCQHYGMPYPSGS